MEKSNLIAAACAYIQQKYPNFQPKVGIILGSGLGSLASEITSSIAIPYSKIPGFPVSTVPGHVGELTLGYLQDVPVACLKGRVHLYEGAKSDGFKTLIRTLNQLGCGTLLTTNAAGSLRYEVGAGELVLITDHINFFPTNPLVGENEETYGPRFLPLDDAYDVEWREELLAAARSLEIPLHEGVYMGLLGPCFETPAEIRAYRTLGADLVGMSTVPEVIVARHCGMRVAGISTVVNLASGMSAEKITHQHTLEYANLAAGKLARIIKTFLGNNREKF